MTADDPVKRLEAEANLTAVRSRHWAAAARAVEAALTPFALKAAINGDQPPDLARGITTAMGWALARMTPDEWPTDLVIGRLADSYAEKVKSAFIEGIERTREDR